MKLIPLYSPSYGIEYAIVDDDDFDMLCGYSWYNKEDKRYPTTMVHYLRGGKRIRRQVLMHHAVIGLPPIGMDTHHINGNPLDNRKCNLQFIDSLEHAYMSCEQGSYEDNQY